MQPVEKRVTANGISLAVFEWNAERRREGTILLAHATGFHARCWDRVVAHLGARHVIAVDQRGHGRSDKPMPVDWQDFGRDLADLVRVLDLTDIVGVGHSMGGHAVVEAAALEMPRFRRLVLIDPVIVAPEVYAQFGDMTGMPHPTAKRRNHWTSPQEMFERFADRPPFAGWDRGVLRDYCAYGLLPNPAGEGLVLACPPDFEASVYMASRRNGGVHDSLRRLVLPVLLVRAREPNGELTQMDFRVSPTWPGLIGQLQNGRELYFPDKTHFLPMEEPSLAAELILREPD